MSSSVDKLLAQMQRASRQTGQSAADQSLAQEDAYQERKGRKAKAFVSYRRALERARSTSTQVAKKHRPAILNRPSNEEGTER